MLGGEGSGKGNHRGGVKNIRGGEKKRGKTNNN